MGISTPTRNRQGSQLGTKLATATVLNNAILQARGACWAGDGAQIALDASTEVAERHLPSGIVAMHRMSAADAFCLAASATIAPDWDRSLSELVHEGKRRLVGGRRYQWGFISLVVVLGGSHVDPKPNLVHGLGPEAGEALTTHADVGMISFTGRGARSSSTPKRTSRAA